MKQIYQRILMQILSPKGDSGRSVF